MTIRPDAEMERALSELASAAHVSKHEIIRAAVLEKWEREGHRALVQEAARQSLARWRDVLDRLGSA